MSPMSTICTSCHRIRPCACADREQARRTSNSKRLGRTTNHWRQLSAQARAQACGYCPRCNRPERNTDAGSKLTADLIGGGQHSTAKLEQVRVMCRRCHGAVDGGRRSPRASFLSAESVNTPTTGGRVRILGGVIYAVEG